MLPVPYKTALCNYEGCIELAKQLAAGHKTTKPAWYCEEHAKKVANEQTPEYRATCPCCGCIFGVN